ncbi:hypothetical protein E1286_19785 [Nonomuraea terrae]|uniref:Uncharacterized protein n=1 Tax=Nonomuraea terrae TaxID=2530383 RepID=A0A4R4YT57_9ACTN|nr:hypothetical protein [Nonomuraea terrae]TDD46782.1 hypothetical protein E1286_19785 [Nonomuraea terrae]
MADYEQVADVLGNTTWITWCTGSTLDDVLALYGGGWNLPMTATFGEADEVAHLGIEEGIPVLFAGALGHGVVLMEPGLPCVGTDERIRLSSAGVCLDVGWSDFGPPHVTYREKGHVVVAFEGIAWEYDATPDQETVERWMSTTPGGLEGWQNNYGTASLMTVEAIMGAPMDEQWLAREHTCITGRRSGSERPRARSVSLGELLKHVAAPVPREGRPETTGEASNSPGSGHPPA